MLGMSARAVLGDAETAWVCETDSDASRVLAERFGVPNHGDITALDWSTVEPVDVMVGGWPCQPFSLAGKRKGMNDERAIWPAFADAIRVVRPRVFLGENVPGILARGQLGRVVADLARIGYVGSWLCLRASDVGAPHQRKRLFVVAADPDREPVRLQPVPVGAREPATVVGGDSPRALMPTPDATDHGVGNQGRDGSPNLATAVALLPTPNATDSGGGGRTVPEHRTHDGPDFGPRLRDVALLLPTPIASPWTRNATVNRDPDDDGHSGTTLADVAYADRWAQYGPAIARWEAVLGRPAPDPTVTGKRGGRRLSGRFCEWLMGWPDGWVTDLVDNTAALRIAGNGVVPQCATAAYRMLMEMSA